MQLTIDQRAAEAIAAYFAEHESGRIPSILQYAGVQINTPEGVDLELAIEAWLRACPTAYEYRPVWSRHGDHWRIDGDPRDAERYCNYTIHGN